MLEHIDQTEESDLHFLSRLSKDHDAISKPVESRLLFVPRGEARSASQQPMPALTLSREALTSYSFTLADRGKYEAAIAHITSSSSAAMNTDEDRTRPLGERAAEAEDALDFAVDGDTPTADEDEIVDIDFLDVSEQLHAGQVRRLHSNVVGAGDPSDAVIAT